MTVSVETQLRERIEQLEAEVRYWRDEARGNAEALDRDALASALDISRGAQAWIVATLYTARGKLISRNRLNDDMPGFDTHHRDSNVVQVMIHRIRTRLGQHFIECHRGAGYCLPPESIALIDNLGFNKKGNTGS